MTTTDDERRAEIMRRGGIDPIRVDRRPLSVIMGDEIPLRRWQHERYILRRAGYRNRQDWLYGQRKK